MHPFVLLVTIILIDKATVCEVRSDTMVSKVTTSRSTQSLKAVPRYCLQEIFDISHTRPLGPANLNSAVRTSLDVRCSSDGPVPVGASANLRIGLFVNISSSELPPTSRL